MLIALALALALALVLVAIKHADDRRQAKHAAALRRRGHWVTATDVVRFFEGADVARDERESDESVRNLIAYTELFVSGRLA